MLKKKIAVLMAASALCGILNLGFNSGQEAQAKTIKYMPTATADESASTRANGTTLTIGQEQIMTDNGEKVLILAKDSNRYGLLNAKGEILLPVAYAQPKQLIETNLLFLPKDKEETATVVSLPFLTAPWITVSKEYDESQETDSYIAFQDPKTKRYGYKNTANEIVVPPIFQVAVTNFTKGVAVVKDRYLKNFLIDSKGAVIAPLDLDEAELYADGIVETADTPEHGIIFKISAPTSKDRSFYKDLPTQVIKEKSKKNNNAQTSNLPNEYFNNTIEFSLGKTVIEENEEAGAHREFFNSVWLGNGVINDMATLGKDEIKRSFFNAQGKRIFATDDYTTVYRRLPVGYIGQITSNYTLDIYDAQGKQLVSLMPYDLKGIDMINGYVALDNRQLDKIGVYNYKTQSVVLPYEYNQVKLLGYGYIAAQKPGQANWSVYQTIPETQAVFSVSGSTEFATTFSSDGHMWLRNDKELSPYGGYKMIDATGKIIVSGDTTSIQEVTDFHGNVSAVKSNGKWGLMNTSGQWLVQPTYQDLNFVVAYDFNFALER